MRSLKPRAVFLGVFASVMPGHKVKTIGHTEPDNHGLL